MKKILFVLSPSLSLYEHFKNLLNEIITSGDEIDIFLPKPVSYKNIISSLYLISEKLGINEFIVLENPLNPFSLSKLKIKEIENLTKKKSFKYQVFIRIFLSRIIIKIQFIKFNPYFGNLVRYISSRKLIINLIGKNIFKTKYQVILYEIFEERKYYLFPYLSYFYKCKRISMFHGNGISSTHFFEKPFWSNLNRLLVLDYTGFNKSQYLYSLSTSKFMYKVIGIPNHYYEKENLINKKDEEIKLLKSKLYLQEETKFMTLTSRPDDSTFCNSKDREAYLKAIGIYLSKNIKWHLLIKAHPKEKEYTKDKWAKFLGLSNNQNNFSITKKSPLELASISNIGFSFVSTSCIDFAFFGTPMFELTSLNKTKFRNKTTFFSKDGFPLTAEAFHKLTINIKSKDELNVILENFENEINHYSEIVNKAYIRCYGAQSYVPSQFYNLLHKKF
tara:strand:+ start:2096 stop:3433 length:1338 start_codon:yes stop_codon:yes gene_type:complete